MGADCCGGGTKYPQRVELLVHGLLTLLVISVMLAMSNNGGNMELSAAKARYLLVIYELTLNKKEPIRPVDIANRIGVSRASVAGMLQELQQAGLVTRSETGEVSLSDSGNDTALELYQQYRTLLRFFLQNLRLDGAQAREDSISAIVNLSPECVRQFSKYIRDVKDHHAAS